MSMINIGPNQGARPVLDAGMYGSGLENEAEVSLFDFEAGCDPPGWDKEGKEGPYFKFSFRVVDPEGTTYFPNCTVNFGKKVKTMLADAGVTVTENPDGGFVFDESEVAPRPVGGIEVKAPSVTDDGTFPGKVLRVIGA